MATTWVRWLDEIGQDDVAEVGGKNASLGEMLASLADAGVRVPDGFATTAAAYRRFLAANGLDAAIAQAEKDRRRGRPLAEVAAEVRGAMLEAPLPDELADAVRAAWWRLAAGGPSPLTLAVRSSATAEDLPEASFAGQQATQLGVRGAEAVLEAIRDCYASLFTERSMSYREAQGFSHAEVALSAGVQRQVRSDLGGAGVAFTCDTETGFPGVVRIEAAWGLGETVVAGEVDPDAYLVAKAPLQAGAPLPIIERRLGEKTIKAVDGAGPPRRVPTSQAKRERLVLDDDTVLQLARWCLAIEDHYGRPMDIEWALDGETGELFIVQARPETVQARRDAGTLRTHRLRERGEALVEGLAVGEQVAAGPVVRLDDPADGARLPTGGVLVTARTDPDWVPVMRRAAAIVTDHGGRTAHAAIVSRELGVPAVVGTGTATRRLADGAAVTVSCAGGETGRVYAGELAHDAVDVDLAALPATRTRVQLNLGDPAQALRWWRLPVAGVGLARLEFIISEHVGVHPLALTRYARITDPAVRERIDALVGPTTDRTQVFVERLASGIARLAVSRFPDPVLVRLSDFKSNEYADLLGGADFEPVEDNPMLGFRGASRYDHPDYRDGFALECRALRMVREQMGLDNVRVLVPFVRTVAEADRVLAAMAGHGLQRARDGLQVWMMAEVPSNVTLVERFAERFDGFSIGSNDLTQLELGVDRDSTRLAELFDERDEAVTARIIELIERAHAVGTPVGICGQGPADHPELCALLVAHGIDSISVSPDRVPAVIEHVAAAEAQQGTGDGAAAARPLTTPAGA